MARVYSLPGIPVVHNHSQCYMTASELESLDTINVVYIMLYTHLIINVQGHLEIAIGGRSFTIHRQVKGMIP